MRRFLNWLRFTFRTDSATWTYCERCERPILRAELVAMPVIALTMVHYADGTSYTVPVTPLWCPDCAAQKRSSDEQS